MTSQYTALSIFDYSEVPGSTIDPIMPGIPDKLKTSHFTLFEAPLQIWREGNHPLGSNYAYGCEYAGEVPLDLAKECVFRYHAYLVRRLNGNSSPVVFWQRMRR